MLNALRNLCLLLFLTSQVTAEVLNQQAPVVSTANEALSCPSLLQHDMEILHSDERQNLCELYAGKVLLIVNTASRCGFTGQLEGLEALYQEFKNQGLVVLGFSSNDFYQELKDEGAIASYCKMNFGVTFPMFGTSSVRGKNANPVYQQLIAQSGKAPGWNFFKYLVGREGKVIDVYSSRVKPESEKLRGAVVKALADSD